MTTLELLDQLEQTPMIGTPRDLVLFLFVLFLFSSLLKVKASCGFVFKQSDCEHVYSHCF